MPVLIKKGEKRGRQEGRKGNGRVLGVVVLRRKTVNEERETGMLGDYRKSSIKKILSFFICSKCLHGLWTK